MAPLAPTAPSRITGTAPFAFPEALALSCNVGQAGGMTSTLPLITADLARAARALAQVSRPVLAEHTGLAEAHLRDVEHGRRAVTAQESELLRGALEEFGVEFLPVDEEAGVGYGVRQKFNPRTVKRLENWENEGGPAAEDDI